MNETMITFQIILKAAYVITHAKLRVELLSITVQIKNLHTTFA